MANKKKGSIEEQILTLMERIEQNQAALKESEAKGVEAERGFMEEKSRVGAMAAQFGHELEQLGQKRQQLVAGLDHALLARYTKLKSARKDVAIVPVRGGICAGCRLQLPPQLVAEVRRSQELQSCSYCHRILYTEGEPAGVSAGAEAVKENVHDAL